MSNESLNLKGQVMPTTATRNISDFVDPGNTPGNVGICLSGGGSVAMMSALGQLRALVEMGVLDKVRAISTVSGGSWATVPFIYLPDNISDDTFLGTYVDNPHDLHLGTPLNNKKNDPTNLSNIPDGYMGQAVAADGIKWDDMAAEALKLLKNPKFPNNRIWNYLIAKHILAPFGLAGVTEEEPVGGKGPKTYGIDQNWFAYSKEEVPEIQQNNPDLVNIPYFTYQQGEGRVKRPYHLCNTSMFITPNDATQASYGNALATVQCTAKATGIFANDIGIPDGSADQGGPRPVGGGLVSSYAFNSAVTAANGDNVEVSVEEGQLFSLADITANSSAFYATAIKQLSGMDPAYEYWPAQDPDAEKASFLTKFADGGAIEDNGLCNLLAYNDIDKAVVFTNALASVWQDEKNNAGSPWNIVVDQWIPTYFGYTPYQHPNKKGEIKSGLTIGYHKYADLDEQGFDYPGKGLRYFRHNQIFDSSLFEEFLATIWKNCNNYEGPSVYHNSNMPVMDNAWFGITGRDIELLLVHYGPYKPFTHSLKDLVKLRLEAYVKKNQLLMEALGPKKPTDGMFPNFILTETHMPAEILNIFAHFTAHVAMTQKEVIQGMFE